MGRGPRPLLWFAIVLACLLVVAGIALSPLLLDAFDGTPFKTIHRRSELGSTYGAAAAVISGLALLAVARSMRSQRQEAHAARVNNSRVLHVELLRMALDDETGALIDAWGPFAEDDRTVRRQHLYVNLILSHWQMAYVLGDLSDDALRRNSAQLFAGEPARRFWTSARGPREQGAKVKVDRRFHEIVAEEAEKAEQAQLAAAAAAPPAEAAAAAPDPAAGGDVDTPGPA
jgi:hypothetical protein